MSKHLNESVGLPSEEPRTAPTTPVQRKLILHYHLFKNAGTSVDAMLKANFRGGWVGAEFAPGGDKGNSAVVEDFIRANPSMTVLSSHTADLPLPRIAGLQVFPVMFLRHPIDRIRSAYEFERKQQADTFGARLAKETDFSGYVRTLLDQCSGQVCDFHIKFLRRGHGGTSDLERAKATLASLPFVGIVEQYSQSVARLEHWLKPDYPDFVGSVTHLNVTQRAERSLDEKIDAIRDELGRDLFEELMKASADDLQLYDWFTTMDRASGAAGVL